jgi:hypothetical protein
MPDPKGGARLLDYDCKVGYGKADMIKPRKIMEPDDMRLGTKKGKLDKHPIWVVEVRMPKQLLADLYGATLEDLDVQEVQGDAPTDQTPAAEDPVAPEAAEAGEV